MNAARPHLTDGRLSGAPEPQGLVWAALERDFPAPMSINTIFRRPTRILALGDVMLDSYAIGAVERISPEAPVPILRHMDHREVPGGCANVAMNIAALGARCVTIGAVGDDDAGRRVAAMLAGAGVETRLVTCPDRPTTSKMRIMAGAHPLLRIDREDSAFCSDEIAGQLLEAVGAEIGAVDGVILSDYAKGVLSDTVLRGVMALAAAQGVPVFVDPKRADWSAYRGATYIKPNRSELRAVAGQPCDTDEEARAAARKAMEASGAHILLTRSERGLALFLQDGGEHILPTEAQEVFDVSGAGDTVIATFALAVLDGQPSPQALRLANCAAGVVVGKSGTATVGPEELAARLGSAHYDDRQGAVRSWPEAIRIREHWRRQNLTVGFANGCFDILHPGHISLLRQANLQCDRLIVALNSDASVQRLKGPTRPVQNEQSRAEVMGAIGFVDMVTIFDQDTPLELICALQPDVLIKGADYKLEEIVGADIVIANGGSVVRADLVAGQSTTSIISRNSQK